MHFRNLLIVVAVSFLATQSRAQETNLVPLYTNLEIFEARANTLIVKGSGFIDAVPAKTGVVSIWCKESQEIASGQKAYGVTIGIKAGDGDEDVTILDYDELESFLASIDFLTRIDVQVTPLPAFNANYTSKGGLKISAYTSNKHAGTIPVALQSNHAFKSRVTFERDQLERFKIAMQEAKAKLDALQEKKP